MKPWDFDTSAGQLRRATEQLQDAWQETADHWQDNVSVQFCRQHLDPIPPNLKQSLDAVSHMQQLINQIHHDCAD